MSFTLTVDHVKSFLDPAGQGDWAPFLNAIDPEVHWLIADPQIDPIRLTGIYNVQSWLESIGKSLRERLIDGKLDMSIDTVDVIGQKAIIEASGSATQKNGRPYHNRYCWILIFSKETGKVVEIREYLNTALVQEVMESNEA